MHRACRAGKVIHPIERSIGDLGHERLKEIRTHEGQAWMIGSVAEILHAAREQVIDDDDLLAAIEKEVDEVAAQQSGATGNEVRHSQSDRPTRSANLMDWAGIAVAGSDTAPTSG